MEGIRLQVSYKPFKSFKKEGDDMYVDIRELSYKDKEILRDAQFSFHEGEFISILGVNGSGKTSFYRALLGLVNYKGSTDITRKEIAVVSDYISLPNETPVVDVRDFIYEHSTLTEEIRKLSTMLNINDMLKTKVHSLSSGQKRKLELLAVLSSGRKVIIYDEITANIDEPSKNAIISFIKEYHSLHNDSLVFYSSHDLKEIFQFGGKKLLINPSTKTIENVTDYSIEDIAMKLSALS